MHFKICAMFLLIFLMFEMSAQEFAPTGAKWYYSNIESAFGPNIGYVTIENVEDTLIQGKLCKKMEEVEYRTSGLVIPERVDYLHVSGDTVWRYADDGQFYVLYNFAADVGDSWPLRAYDYTTNVELSFEVTVDSIAYTTINGTELKEMHLVNSSDYLTLNPVVERLGGISFFYPMNYAWLDSDVRTGLRCYGDPAFGDYMAVDTISCNALILDAAEVIDDQYLNIYPNPTSGRTTIAVNQPRQLVEQIRIYSMEGMLLKIFNDIALTFSTEIELPKAGMFLVEFSGHKTRVFRKLINH